MPTAELSKPTSDSSEPRAITREEIEWLMERSSDVIRACFSATTDEAVAESMTVNVALSYSAAGEVVQTRIEGGPAPSADRAHLADCLRQVFEGWRLDPIGSDGARVELPITFRPTAPLP